MPAPGTGSTRRMPRHGTLARVVRLKVGAASMKPPRGAQRFFIHFGGHACRAVAGDSQSIVLFGCFSTTSLKPSVDPPPPRDIALPGRKDTYVLSKFTALHRQLRTASTTCTTYKPNGAKPSVSRSEEASGVVEIYKYKRLLVGMGSFCQKVRLSPQLKCDAPHPRKSPRAYSLMIAGFRNQVS